MAKRKRVADAIQAEVLVKSRRRCCVCFGLGKDDQVKQGQLAHLDQDRTNNGEENLVFLCLAHHDQFDSRTSQSKNLTQTEVERYRQELYQHFSPWNRVTHSEQLLNFLAAYVDIEVIAKTLVKIGQQATAFPEYQLKLALTETDVESLDGDIALPLIHILDHLASWGFVTYELQEPNDSDLRFKFKIVQNFPDRCQELAKAVEGTLNAA
jgi:hypothetical protein